MAAPPAALALQDRLREISPGPDLSAPGGTVKRVTDQTPLRELIRLTPTGLFITDMSHPRVRRLKRQHLSVSSAQKFTESPARFAIESLLERVENPFGAAELGTAAHKVLELLFQLPPAERTSARASEILNKLIYTHPSEICFPLDPIEQGAWRSEVAAALVGLWRIEDPTTVEVVATEMSFRDVLIGGVPALGFIDRTEMVGRDDDGVQVKVVDYKSGAKVKKPYKSNDPYGDQLRIYALAHEQLRGRLPVKAALHYIRLGQTHEVDLSPDALRKTERAFAKAWRGIQEAAETGEYPCKPSPLCSWCPLATVCPAAIAAGRNKPHRNQKPEDFAAITEVGERLQLPLLSASNTTSNPENTMSDSTTIIKHPQLSDDKSWEELAEGKLNPNSYAAGAAYGLVELAVETLEGAGRSVTPKAVRALSATFASIIEQVQREMTRHSSFQEGAHTRLRGALRVTLRSFPLPFGSDAAGFADWQDRVVRRIGAIANTAYWLWDLSANGFGAQPWADLVDGDVPAPAADTHTGEETAATAPEATAAVDAAEVEPAVEQPEPASEPNVAAPTQATDDDFEEVTEDAPAETAPEPVAQPEPEETQPAQRELASVGASAAEDDYDPAADFDDF